MASRTEYVAPKVHILGTVGALTLMIPKKSGVSDGLYLLTIGPLTNSSA